jgi:hypothetical protein
MYLMRRKLWILVQVQIERVGIRINAFYFLRDGSRLRVS